MASVITVGELPKLASRDDNIKHRITTLLKNLSEDWRERKRDWRTGKVISSTLNDEMKPLIVLALTKSKFSSSVEPMTLSQY